MRQILQPVLNCWGRQSVRETGLLITLAVLLPSMSADRYGSRAGLDL